jgi:hypothetical protein
MAKVAARPSGRANPGSVTVKYSRAAMYWLNEKDRVIATGTPAFAGLNDTIASVIEPMAAE